MTDDQLLVVAQRVLTEKQYDIVRLWAAGVGTSRIALALDISQSTVRSQLTRSLQKIKLELEREAA